MLAASVRHPERKLPSERCVNTTVRVSAPPEKVWSGLLYYEQIDERPPLLLRLLLPVPVSTQGRKSEVGDEVHCEYANGYLRKRIAEIEPGRLSRFIVIEQALDVGSTQLLGGAYTIRPLEGGGTELSLKTRYLSHRRPRWLWKPIEAAVCHVFHRHILGAMRRRVEATS